MALKTKNGDLRTTAISAGIGALLSGVSEPALYGVNLRYKTPMVGVVAGGLVGGGVAGVMGAKAFSMGYSSIQHLFCIKMVRNCNVKFFQEKN